MTITTTTTQQQQQSATNAHIWNNESAIIACGKHSATTGAQN